MSDSPNEQRKAFRILDLPAELRENIYECALHDSNHAYDGDELGDVWIDRRLPSGVMTFKFPVLFHVSRQLRAEAAGVWFKKFRFLFEEVKPRIAWLDMLDEEFRKQLKTLQRKAYDGYSPEPSRKEMRRRSRRSKGGRKGSAY